MYKYNKKAFMLSSMSARKNYTCSVFWFVFRIISLEVLRIMLLFLENTLNDAIHKNI